MTRESIEIVRLVTELDKIIDDTHDRGILFGVAELLREISVKASAKRNLLTGLRELKDIDRIRAKAKQKVAEVAGPNLKAEVKYLALSTHNGKRRTAGEIAKELALPEMAVKRILREVAKEMDNRKKGG